MKRMLLCAVIGSLSLAACAQAPQTPATAAAPAAKPASAADKSADENVRQALKALNPDLQIDYIGAAPIAGFRQAVAGGSVVFVSDDGRYLVQGDVIDLKTRRNIGDSNAGLAAYRRGLLETVPHAQRIVFAPPNPKYTVSVFTDIECGYCRKLHSQITDYNKQGIAIEYLAFPRMGLGTKDHKDMVSVWCAADPKSALTAAKSGKPAPARDCDNPVASEFALGQRLGVTGTPAVFAPDGTQIGGYLTPEQMRATLDSLSSVAGGGR
ncbi:MAG: thioredoxin fold domain-containing protein [Pseudoxanthomonas sp.]